MSSTRAPNLQILAISGILPEQFLTQLVEFGVARHKEIPLTNEQPNGR